MRRRDLLVASSTGALVAINGRLGYVRNARGAEGNRDGDPDGSDESEADPCGADSRDDSTAGTDEESPGGDDQPSDGPIVDCEIVADQAPYFPPERDVAPGGRAAVLISSEEGAENAIAKLEDASSPVDLASVKAIAAETDFSKSVLLWASWTGRNTCVRLGTIGVEMNRGGIHHTTEVWYEGEVCGEAITPIGHVVRVTFDGATPTAGWTTFRTEDASHEVKLVDAESL